MLKPDVLTASVKDINKNKTTYSKQEALRGPLKTAEKPN